MQKDRYTCYHGTIQRFADNIKNTKEFKIETRNNHWLGNGVYFFVNNRYEAEWWSEQAKKKFIRENKPDKTKVKRQVIRLQVKIDPEKLLDLDVVSETNDLYDFICELEKENININIFERNKSQHDKEIARCLIIDLYAKCKEYKAACYTFESKVKLDERFNDFWHNIGLKKHVKQLCVFDQSIIDFNTYKEIM